jgi:hypothetical protein
VREFREEEKLKKGKISLFSRVAVLLFLAGMEL